MTTTPKMLWAALLTLTLSGCKKEVPEYRFTAEQLAWQPYRTGDVLRFGHARNGRIRTFRISKVDDRIESPYNCGGIALGGCPVSRLQYITVEAQRTDTVRYFRHSATTTAPSDSSAYNGSDPLLEMWLDDDHGSSATPVVVARLTWDFSALGGLPLQGVTAGTVVNDATVQVLPAVQLGGSSYGQTLLLTRPATVYQTYLRARPVRSLYYAKGHGVVGFVEQGADLWYRLP